MDLTPDDILYSYKEEEEESRVEVSSLSGFGPRECLPEDSGRIEQPNYQPARNIHNDKAAYPIRDTA